MHKKRSHSHRKKIFGHFTRKELGLLALAVWLAIGGVGIFWISSFTIPDLESFNARRISQSTKIYDRTGEILLYDVHQDIKRTIIPAGEISRNIKNAVVAIEDAEFYQHYGIKPSAIVRAVLVNLGSFSFSQGGSTITQQVVKNSILTSERNISRKLKEWVLAVKLEKVMDKDAILSLYLNESPFGGNIYGVEQASQSFFNKNSSKLTVAESAYLASLLKAPTFFSPYGKNKDRLVERHFLVLAKMFEHKFITEEEYAQAKNEEVIFNPQEKRGIKAPHFVTFVIDQLHKKYGERTIEDGGLKVITSLDYDLQLKAEEIVEKFAKENEKKFNAENAALTAINPKTGEILVMVGSRDYFDKDIDGNFNVATAFRQPGSAFKPIVYVTAFEKGYEPETVLFDLETEFSTECNPDGTPKQGGARCYRPQNYDEIFRGPVSLRRALAESLNIPSIKLLYLTGIKEALRTAKNLGITSLTNADRYGLTLVLGGGEVSLLDLTSAYTVFANNGERNPYQSILQVENSEQKVLEKFEARSTRVLGEDSVAKLSSVLSDNKARSPNAFLQFEGRDVAAKTGTTNDYRDAWVVGYTPNLAVGVWAGNNDNTAMEKKVAGFIAAPLWGAFMREALKKLPDEKFKKPSDTDLSLKKPALRGAWQGGDSYFIDIVTGKLATEFTPIELRQEKFITDAHSILYWVDKDDPLGPKPMNPANDPQFSHWEYSVRKWVATQGIIEGGNIPQEVDSVHTPEFAPKITITNPVSNASYLRGERITATITHMNQFLLSKVDYFLNGTYLGSSIKEPFSFSFLLDDSVSIGGVNELRVVGYDSVYNRGETIVRFNVQ